ncbi:MAG: hypothetical protein H6Q90_1282 [Deltaproteobacteria bacterium]|nr:hypothetical protein [Deltaproteobacteria bacterium]
MTWVLAVERAYVTAATGGRASPVAIDANRDADRPRALGALGAIASHYLAVGTPRSFALVVDGTPDAAVAARASLEAHRTWFQPRDLRVAGDAALAVALGAASVPVAEALAADIVCVHAPLTITAAALRRGTHVNVLAPAQLDDDLRRLATIVHEVPGLGALAAGLVDGRQLDELTVFIAGDAAIALAELRSWPPSPSR